MLYGLHLMTYLSWALWGRYCAAETAGIAGWGLGFVQQSRLLLPPRRALLMVLVPWGCCCVACARLAVYTVRLACVLSPGHHTVSACLLLARASFTNGTA